MRGLLVFFIPDGAGEVQGYGEDEFTKIAVRFDLDLSRTAARDEKPINELLLCHPQERKTRANINSERAQWIDFLLFFAPRPLVRALELPPSFWVCIRHNEPPPLSYESVNP